MEPKIISDLSPNHQIEIGSQLSLPKRIMPAPSLQLLNLLISKGIIDPYGSINQPTHTGAGCCVEIFNERMEAFLSKKRRIFAKEIDLGIEISIHEIIQYLQRIEPAVTIEILKKDALHFLGFEVVEETFKSWGIDLVETCGEKYVQDLKNEIEQPPSFFLIQYFISQIDPRKILHLKKGIVHLISSKLPFEVTDPDYEQIKNRLVDALCNKPEGQYSHWFPDFEYPDKVIKDIAAEEFFVNKQVEPKWRSPNPFGCLSLEFAEGEKIEFEFSHSVPLTRQRYATDCIHLPLTSGLETQELQKFDCHLTQGFIDWACKNNTASYAYICVEDWFELLLGTVQGKTTRIPSFQNTIVLKILEIAYNTQREYPEIPLGEIVGRIFLQCCNKIFSDNSKINTSEQLLTLSIAACESLFEHINPNDLKSFIHTVSHTWNNLIEKDNGTFFYSVAKALNEGISYTAISAYLQIGAYQQIHDGYPSPKTDLWFNQRGWEGVAQLPAPAEDILQLELKNVGRSFFIQILNRPVQTVLKLLECSPECLSHEELLHNLVYRLSGKERIRRTMPYQDVWIPFLEDSLPIFLNHLIHLLQKYPEHHLRLQFFAQFVNLLSTRNHLLNAEESETLTAVLKKLSTKKDSTFDSFATSVMEFFGTSHNRLFNQAAYELFKKQKPSKLQTCLAEALSKGSILYALKTFIRMSKEKKVNQNFLLKLLDNLCLSLKKQDRNEISCYLDILEPAVKSLLENKTSFPSAAWLSGQFALTGEDLETDLSRVEKVCVPSQHPSMGSKEDLLNAAYALLEKGELYKFSSFVNSNEFWKAYKDNPQEWWDLLLPIIKNSESSSILRTYSLYAICLKKLNTCRPNPETLIHFSIALQTQCKNLNQPLPKQLKRAIIENQHHLFKALADIQQMETIVDLLHIFSYQHLQIKFESLKSIFKAIFATLEKSSSPEEIKKITELMNGSILRDAWDAAPKNYLKVIYQKLTLIFLPSHFDLAFKYFLKFQDSCDVQDDELISELMNKCGELNKCQEFAQLTNSISSFKEQLLSDCWKNNFNILFSISSQEELHERQLNALNTLVKCKELPKLIHSPSFLDKLLEVKTYSPFFNKCLNLALQIISYGTVPTSQTVSFYKLLEFSSDPIFNMKAWNTLSGLKYLAKEEMYVCLYSLLQGIMFHESDKIFDILKKPSDFPFFKINSPMAKKACIIIFENWEKNWKTFGSAKALTQVKNIYNSLIAKWKTSEETAQIHLAFSKCLCASQVIKNQNQSLKIYLDVLKEHFSKEGAQWDAALVNAGKKILKSPFLEKNEVYPLAGFVDKYPNHEIGGLIIMQLLPKHSGRDLKTIGDLLFCLLKNSKTLNSENFSAFHRFCREINIKAILAEMLLLVDPFQNLIVNKCLNLKEIYKFIDKEWITENLFKSYLSIFKFFITKRIYIPEFTYGAILHIPHFINLVEKEEFEEYIQSIFQQILIEYACSEDRTIYLYRLNLIEERVDLFNVNKELSVIHREQVLNISDTFINFCKSFMHVFLTLPCSQEFVKAFYFNKMILAKGLNNPELINNAKYVEIVITYGFHFSDVSKKVSVEKISDSETPAFPLLENSKNAPIVEFSENEALSFPLKVYECLAKNKNKEMQPILSGYKMCLDFFELLNQEEKPLKKPINMDPAPRYIYQNEKHEIIKLLSDLLNIKEAEIVIYMALNIITANINELIPSYLFLFEILKKMSIYAHELKSSSLQGLFFHLIAKIHIQFSDRVAFRDRNSKHFKKFQECILVNLSQMTNMFKTSTKIEQIGVLIAYFPDILTSYQIVYKNKEDLFKKNLQDFKELCIAHMYDSKISVVDLRHAALAYFKALVNSPDFKNIKKTRLMQFVQWIEDLLKIGNDIDQFDKILLIARSLLKKANKKKFFDGYKEEFRNLTVLLFSKEARALEKSN